MSVLDWFKKWNKEDEKLPVPYGVCPNCWGRQEYEGEIRDAVRDRQIDINNHASDATRAFIQDFVVQKIDGIKLQKDGDSFSCPRCASKD